MNVHVPSDRSLRGFWLTSVTVVLWGTLPFVLKDLLRAIDPVTLSSSRLLGAGLVLAGWLVWHRRLPLPTSLGRRGAALLALAVLGLASNYVLYVLGLGHLTPGTAQLLIQLAPILLLLGSLIVFRERLTRLQLLGCAVLIAGFAGFFNERIGELLTPGTGYAQGVFFIVLAAITWAGYGLAQKQLLAFWPSMAVMAWVNLGCALVLAPWSAPASLLGLTPLRGLLFAASVLNTLIAYGTFAEALAHWEASKVSATLAVSPVITFALAPLVARLWPGFAPPEQHNLLAYLGAAAVVSGSMLVALAPVLRQRLLADRSAR
jgi:drug/metabolite transporter (DMT)-like permease